jgi:hypothetical protein
MTTIRTQMCWWSALAMIAAVTAGAAESTHRRAGPLPSGPQPLRLRVELSVDKHVPTLVFVLENCSNEPVENHPPGYDNNSIEVLRPDGSVGVNRIGVGAFADDTPVIAPGETVRHPLQLAEVARACGMTRHGSYRLFWRYEGSRSAEVLLSRDADDPDEGRKAAPADQNLDTPRAALLTFLRGLDGDVGELGAVMLPPGDEREEREAYDLLMRRAGASAVLRQHLEAKFGKEASSAWALESAAETLDAVRKGAVTFPEHFEQALLGASGRRFRLVRQANHWFVCAAHYAADAALDRADFSRRTEAILLTADAVSRKRFNSVGEVTQALSERADKVGRNKGSRSEAE